MSKCIYCRSEVPSDAPREHVIPQGFGVFKPDITLDCVCKDCNHYFGSKLEWRMRVESLEGMRRLQFGLTGVVGGIGANNVVPVIAEGDDWKGARTIIRTDGNGKMRTEIPTQVGARRNPSEGFEWRLERDLSVEWADRFPKGSEFRLIGGEGPADSERLLKKWIEVCPTFVYGGTMEPPFVGNDGMILLHVEHQNSPAVVRCLCKIAFNYMAHTCGQQFALSSSFDAMRSFVRCDSGDPDDAEGRAFLKSNPIIAQEIVHRKHVTDGHVLTIDCRPHDRVVEVQVALFNSIHYRIPMCRDYLGHRFTRGHHFSVHTGEASEMRTAIAGPDFDPSSLGA
jgi:HNH endonuclease